MNDVHYSSKNKEWETPSFIFEPYKDIYNIVIDTCATKENTKCNVYFDRKTNGLKADWSVVKVFGKDASCWMNPPYGREVGNWVKKAHEESLKGVRTIALLPARTDTKWFHSYILGNHRIKFLKGRIKFANAKSSAPFPSMIVIFEPLKSIDKLVIKFVSLFNKETREEYKEIWKK